MKNNEAATMFCEAIRSFTSRPDNLENLESYLSHHFDVWMKKFANDPEGLATEMKHFATMEIYED